MDVREDGIQLGWEGDDGFGELLIERLLAGSLDVLYEPTAVLDDEEIEELRSSVGQELSVFDADGEPRCNVLVLEVFVTTWGDPDPRLVRGDGYENDVEGWRRANRALLEGALEEAGVELDESTELVVQRVEVTAVADPG